MNCKNCNNQINEESKFCGKCGIETGNIGLENTREISKINPYKKSQKFYLVIISVCIVLYVIFFFLSEKTGNDAVQIGLLFGQIIGSLLIPSAFGFVIVGIFYGLTKKKSRSYFLNKFFSISSVLIILFFIFSVIGQLSNNTNSVPNDIVSISRIEDVVRSMNKELPAIIEPGTVLQSVEYTQGVMMYNYTLDLEKSLLNLDLFKTLADEQFRKNACLMNQEKPNEFPNLVGATFFDKNNLEIEKFIIDLSKDC